MATAHSSYLDVPCTSDQPMPPFPCKVIGMLKLIFDASSGRPAGRGMAHGAPATACSFCSQTVIGRPGAGLPLRLSPRLPGDGRAHVRQRLFPVAKAAPAIRGTANTDDDDMSDRRMRSARNTASTSGRAPHSEKMEFSRGRNAAYRPEKMGKSRAESPDGSWSYAFAASTTKVTTGRTKAENGQSSGPGEPTRDAASYASSVVASALSCDRSPYSKTCERLTTDLCIRLASRHLSRQ